MYGKYAEKSQPGTKLLMAARLLFLSYIQSLRIKDRRPIAR